MVLVIFFLKKYSQIHALPNKVRRPIMIKHRPAAVCRKWAGIYLIKNVPAKTPINELTTKAKDAPIKTGNMDFAWVASSIVCNCVLSPNSAIKTIQKVLKITRNI